MTKRRLSTLSRSIAGKVALVTGAASGMGRATAQLFADEGAKVAVQDVNAAGVEAVVREIIDAGGIAAGFVTDLSDAAAIVGLVDQVVAKFTALDILVNNAGISRPVPIVAPDYDAIWDAIIAVNLAAQVR